MFAQGATPGKVDTWSYDEEDEDFTQGTNVQNYCNTWVLDQLWTLFQNASSNDLLDSELRADKMVFFLHLLGLDTTDHSYRQHSKEYTNNIQVVDRIVRQTEELFSNFYHDEETSFVFTADHGMPRIGNHDDGGEEFAFAFADPDNTRTPLIAWGRGIRGPLTGIIPSSHDEYSRLWQLDDFLRRDGEQADLAPLIAALLGINFSGNPSCRSYATWLLATARRRVSLGPACIGKCRKYFRILPSKTRDRRWFESRREITELIKVTLQGLRYLETGYAPVYGCGLHSLVAMEHWFFGHGHFMATCVMAKSHLVITLRLLLSWMSSCLVTGIFPLLSVNKREDLYMMLQNYLKSPSYCKLSEKFTSKAGIVHHQPNFSMAQEECKRRMLNIGLNISRFPLIYDTSASSISNDSNETLQHGSNHTSSHDSHISGHSRSPTIDFQVQLHPGDLDGYYSDSYTSPDILSDRWDSDGRCDSQESEPPHIPSITLPPDFDIDAALKLNTAEVLHDVFRANGLEVDGSGPKWTLHCPDCKSDSTDSDLDLDPLNFSDSETQLLHAEAEEPSIDIPTELRLNTPDSLLKVFTAGHLAVGISNRSHWTLQCPDCNGWCQTNVSSDIPLFAPALPPEPGKTSQKPQAIAVEAVWRYNMPDHVVHLHKEYIVPGRREGGVMLPPAVWKAMKLMDLEQSVACIPKDHWQSSFAAASELNKENVQASGSWGAKRPTLESSGSLPSKRAHTSVSRLQTALTSLN
ncbi:uncharacterized protein F5891DRAFT_973675 [Suillus fuscotomentosus]|uniref:GPI ethanolamine phosphate transferase 1 n=1 Tax=Suillus fuscotomentosus TaxID=1912939 RepID=A0AAD4HTN1_9AGAM|nr:uncharacterized protein F5891DRAFT_973675 [Suillus fuscotomentosus]KAG1908202.1 hypothetical protein F5891DRAFT_973675 [Suillus fuscotomentosus]